MYEIGETGEIWCQRCWATMGMFKRDRRGDYYCANCWVARAEEAEAKLERLEALRAAVADYMTGCDCVECYPRNREIAAGDEGTHAFRKCIFECPMDRVRRLLKEIEVQEGGQPGHV